MKRIWLLMALAACSDPTAPAPQQFFADSAPRPFDAASPDAAVDVDAGSDASMDTGIADAGERDAGFEMPPDPEPEPLPPVCDELAEPSTCDACEAGFVCVEALCGGEVCMPGRFCADNSDCGGRACVIEEEGLEGVCSPIVGECTSSAECALGFACEAGACVDRRVPCGIVEDGCPRGYLCSFAVVLDLPVCVPAFAPCARDSECEPGARCIDVNGDGATECQTAGLCDTSDDCEEGLHCGVDPGTTQSACVADGPCNETCGEGLECVDLGVGTTTCVPTGGECASNAECAAGMVCASPREGASPRCLGV
ncbi:MAG: hypothetical protein AAGE52_22620 [Myxococcota bacterium]